MYIAPSLLLSLTLPVFANEKHHHCVVLPLLDINMQILCLWVMGPPIMFIKTHFTSFVP